MGRTILFSGRYDPPHLGHLLTFQRLATEYDKVIICILDYPRQFKPIRERLKTIEVALGGCIGSFEVIVNSVNLEHATQEDMDTLPAFDCVGTGNQGVYFNMVKLGIPVVEIKRTPGYNASDSRKFQKLIKFLEDEWGVK